MRVWTMAIGVVLLIGALTVLVAPGWGPFPVGLGVATAFWPLVKAWRAAIGTALRPAVAWAGVALGLGLFAQVVAWHEALASGRPMAGHIVYLSALSMLAALVSVLNARRPGGGAWAILMALLVLVFLIPWLQGSAWARQAHGLSRLRLDSPWGLFYGLVVLAGVTNYLPTRYGLAAAWLGIGYGFEYLALTQPGFRLSQGARLWSLFPWLLSLAVWTAWWSGARRSGHAQTRLDSTWLWFRDHWGVVWALRVQERFNRAAETSGWDCRLGWYGVATVRGAEAGTGEAGRDAPADAAESTLLGLLRRFADLDRIQLAGRAPAADPCDLGDIER